MTVQVADFHRCFALGCVTALLLSACGGNGENEVPTTAEGEPEPATDADVSEFTIAWHDQPPNLDPMVSTATATSSITRNIFEPLIVPDADGELQPVLAESWEVSDDASTIVFTIRDGVSFHDGSDLTAEDVAASLERWMEVSNLGQEFFANTEVEVTDDLEVALDLGEPMYSALYLIGAQTNPMPVLPASIMEAAPESGFTNEDAIGTGPYTFNEWVTDQRVSLELNEDYSPAPGEPSGFAGDRTGTFENLIYEFVPDDSTRVAGIQSGEYDAAMNIPLDNVQQLEDDPNVDVQVNDSIQIAGAIFNKAEGPMSDPIMRRAVAAALDYNDIQLAAYVDEEFHNVNGSLMFEDSPWYTEAGFENFNPESDPDLAEELLDEAGYDGETIRILSTRDTSARYDSGIMMEQQLEEVGINVELIVLDWPSVMELREEPSEHEISLTGFTFPAVPAAFLFLTESYTGWTDDEAISEAMDAMVYAPDEESSLQAADDLQAAFYEYLPIMKFGDHGSVTAVQSGFAGYEPPPSSEDLFYRVYPTEE